MPYETKYTDDEILDALVECLKEATIPSTCVANKLGANSEYIKKRLLRLLKQEKIVGERTGRAWCFRPKE